MPYAYDIGVVNILKYQYFNINLAVRKLQGIGRRYAVLNIYFIFISYLNILKELNNIQSFFQRLTQLKLKTDVY